MLLATRIGLTVLFLLAAPCAFAQSASGDAGSLAREGLRLVDEGKLAEAEAAFQQVLGTSDGASAARASALRGMALVKYRRSDYLGARALLTEALPLFEARADREGVARVKGQLGSVAFITGDIPKARELYEESVAEFDALGMQREKALGLRNMAFVLDISDPRLTAALETSLSIATELGDRRLQGLTLHVMGDLWVNRGDFRRGRQSLHDAVVRLEETNSTLDLARAFVSLGRLHRQHGLPEEAVPFYMRALAAQRQLGDKQGIAQSLNAIGIARSVAGHNREAFVAFQEGLDIARSSGFSTLAELIQKNIAWVHLKSHDYARVIALLEPIVHGSREPYNVAQAMPHLAMAYLGAGDLKSALAVADKAIEARDTEAENLPNVFYVRARAHEALGQPASARGDIDRALAATEQLRQRLVPLDYMKRGFAGRYLELLGFSVRLLHRLGETAAALEAAEKARARAFLDLLATRESRREIPVDRQQLESSKTAAAMTVEEFAVVARRLDSTILSYWVGDDQTFAWIVRADRTISTVAIPVTSARLAALVRQAASEVPNRAGRALYDLLVGPLRHLLPAERGSLLTIIPHGPLFRLSFAALQDPSGRYLLEDVRLHYAPAGAVLRRAERPAMTPDRFAQMNYLLVGNPEAAGRGEAPATLPGAAREIDAIGRIVPAGAIRSLAGAAASEEAVRDAMTDRAVIHLATHGVLRDDDRSAESYLMLAKSGADPARDGQLTTDEIYGLNLDADLVVLSACRTASGPVTGDGVVGMTRAFFYAGARSIIGSLSDVADESAARLMPVFYRVWPHALEKATALRVAQLDLLERLRRGQVAVETPAGRKVLKEAPFLWAPFILIGEP